MIELMRPFLTAGTRYSLGVVVVLLLLISGSSVEARSIQLNSTQLNSTQLNSTQPNPAPSTCCKRFFDKVWGEPFSSSVRFLPKGYHFGQGANTDHTNNNQYYISLNIHGVTGVTFVNTFHRRIYALGLERQIYKIKRLSITYMFGLMQGYKGQGAIGHLGPILGHDPGPVIGLTANWSITKHLSLSVLTYGLGALGGVSYIF